MQPIARLYAEHRSGLYLFCLARTHDPDLAEDIVQESFVKALAPDSGYDPARPFWPWIASIAARECIDAHRRNAYAVSRLGRLACDAGAHGGDPTLGAVLDKLDGARLDRQLAALPARQRLALQLSALDDWSYADIAAQLGESVAAVRSLILRARARLRDAAARWAGGVAGTARAMWSRVEQVAERFHGAMTAAGDLFTWAWGGGYGSVFAALGVSVVAVLLPVSSSSSSSSSAAAEAPTVQAAPSTGPRTVARFAEGAVAVAPSSTGTGPAEGATVSWEEPAWRSVASELQPRPDVAWKSVFGASSREPTPDEMHSAAVAASPDYENDGTAYAGSSHFPYVLFATRDGGASWSRLPAIGFAGARQLLLPPAYPRDPRIFAVGIEGLQVSRDGGKSFDTLVHAGGIRGALHIAAPIVAELSPGFNDGDPTIVLVGGGKLFEYHYDTGGLKSLVLDGDLSDDYVDIARYAPDPAGGRHLVVATTDSKGGAGHTIAGCTVTAEPQPTDDRSVLDVSLPVGATTLSCTTRSEVPGHGRHVRLKASGDGPSSTLVLLSRDLSLSLDGGRTFEARNPWPSAIRGSWEVKDVAVSVEGARRQAVIAVGRSFLDDPSLAGTDDGGATWRRMMVDLPGFESGAHAVAITPTGRILATGFTGIACSADGGRTWATRCPTPEPAGTPGG